MKWQVALYVVAVLIPLAAFAVEVLFIRQLKRLCAYLATGGRVGLSFLLSLVGFVDYYTIKAKGFWAEHHAEAEPGVLGEDTDAALHIMRLTARTSGEASYDWVVLGGKPLTGPTNDPYWPARHLQLSPGRVHRQPAYRWSCS